MDIGEVKNSSFTILGAGRSGIAVAKLLKKHGAKVFLSEGLPEEKLKYFNAQPLIEAGIPYETGGHSDRIYENGIFIKSPGIFPESIEIETALKAGKKIYSEIEAAYWFCKCPIIAITGTNGKTTTTVLTGEIFKNAGIDTKVCGNVGVAFSEVVEELTPESVAVLEVSSFQLEHTEEFRPKVSAFLNFTADHLDWHKTIENYFNAKMKIQKNQKDDDLFVFNADDAYISERVKAVKPKKAGFSIQKDLRKEGPEIGCFLSGDNMIYYDTERDIERVIMNKDDMLLKGNHNVYNYLASVIMAKKFGIDDDVIEKTLCTFLGVEHRIEFVRELNGVKFYNDSKATNIDSMIMALKSFDRNIILILGGKRGDSYFSDIMDLMKEKVKKIIAIGETKNVIKEYFSSIIDVNIANTMKDAVTKAYKNSKPGDVILLSPAYKSFDMFDNFEHRGKEFKKSVLSLK